MKVFTTWLAPLPTARHEEIFRVLIDHLRLVNSSLDFWYRIQRVSKYGREISKEIFSLFYCIPRQLGSEAYTNIQIDLLKRYSHYFQFHTSWFLSLVRHNMVDLVGGYEGCDFSQRVDCQQLQCPGKCFTVLDKWDKILLLNRSIDLRENETTKKEILDSIGREDFDTFLPYLVYHTDAAGLTTIVAKNERFLRGSFCHELYFLLRNQKRALADSVCGHKLGAPRISALITGYSCLWKMLCSPEVKISNAYQVIEPAFKEVIYLILGRQIGIKLAKIEMLHTLVHRKSLEGQWMIKLLVTGAPQGDAEATALPGAGGAIKREFLVFDTGYHEAYIISKCIRLISKLTHIDTAVPKIMMAEGSLCFMELPADTLLRQPEKDSYNIDIYASFTAFSYMFGLSEKHVAYSPFGPIHLSYARPYRKDKIRLSNIIKAFEGRASAKYQQFITVTVRNCMLIREWYKLVIAFTQLIFIKREVVDSRFRIDLSYKEAEAFYAKQLEENSNKIIGKWSLFGY